MKKPAATINRSTARLQLLSILLLLFGVMAHSAALQAQDGSSDAESPPPSTGVRLPVAAMSLELPAGPMEGSVTINQLADEDFPKQGSSPPAAATPGWTTILFEDAEGSFPSGNAWNVFDNNAASGDDYWDDLSCRSYNGSWSVWSADIGDQTNCVNYDNDMTSWMIFGPFSLADASDARVEFRVWSETERPDIPFDYFFWGASDNGTNFHGMRLTADTNWGLGELDLTNVPTVGDLTGDSSVWIAFVFISDSSVNNFEGSYVDDILIEKLVSTPQVDLVATDVFFRDQPQNGGNIITNPTPSDVLYPHFTYTVNSSSSVTGKIWKIEINNSTLCTLTATEPSGSRVGWCNSPISLQPGLHSLHGELDPDQTIGETNENNNDAFRNYNVAGLPGPFTLSNESPVCDTQPPGPSPAVRLNWMTSSGATSYDVYRNGSFYSGGHTGNTFYNSANVVAGQTYTYFIRAQSSAGSTDSNTITVSIPSDICAPDIRIQPLTLNFDSQNPGPIQSDEEKNRLLLKSRQFIPDATSTIASEVFPTPRHLILQFEDEPHVEILEMLAQLDVQILHRVPRNAIIARVPPNTDLATVAGIRWVGALRPEDKVSSRVESAMIDGFAVIDFFPGVGEIQALATIEVAGGQSVPNRFLQPGSHLVAAGVDVVRELSLFDEVSWIRAASPAEIAGEELFHCAGGLAPLGSVANFVVHDDGWDGPGQGTAHDLLFHFDNGTADISGSLEEPELARAFNEWTKHAAVSYTETNVGGLNRSMDVAWVTGDHGDGFPFDGIGGVLAHNFFPSPPNSEPIAGDLHFDDDDTWRIGAGTGFDLFSVALHEAGHGLGLGHSDDPAAVMFPSISSATVFTQLNADDIAGIQTIYAPASGANSFTVFNDGQETLNVTSMSLDSPASWISWSPATLSVPASGSGQVVVTVDFDSAPTGQSTRRLLVVSNDPDESPYPGGVNIIVNNTPCYSLSLSHTGSGSDPTASPGNSSGCSAGQYHAGENVSLTASPSSGWEVGSWSGTSNNSSTSTSNSLVMPVSSHSASVNYVQTPVPCYSLSLSHTGSGSDPVASPGSSSGCSAGQYHGGQSISLTASPSSGWGVGSWSGTSNDSSTSTSNSLMMPASSYSASVNYLCVVGCDIFADGFESGDTSAWSNRVP